MSLEIFPHQKYEPIDPEELEMEYAPKNAPSKIVIPKDADLKPKLPDYKDEKIDKSRRNFFIKGVKGAGTIAAIATIEKTGIFGKALDSISEAFSRIGNRIGEKTPASSETVKTEEKIKNIADHYLKAHDPLVKNQEYFPRSLFSDDLLIAQEIQESGCDIDARSSTGAVGLMQTMEISIQDVSLFLERLHNNGIIEYDGPIYVGDIESEIKQLRLSKEKIVAKNNPANYEIISNLDKKMVEWEKELDRKKTLYKDRVLSGSDLVALEKWIMHDPKYSRALGELYLMKLYNKEYGYGAGNDKFNNQMDIKEAQTEILGAYNAGYNHVKNKPIEEWYKEPRTYVNRIFNLMERAENVRDALAQNGLDGKNNDVVKFITLELNKVSTGGDRRQEVLAKATDYLVSLIKKREHGLGRKLNKDDVDEIRKELSHVTEISSNIFYI